MGQGYLISMLTTVDMSVIQYIVVNIMSTLLFLHTVLVMFVNFLKDLKTKCGYMLLIAPLKCKNKKQQKIQKISDIFLYFSVLKRHKMSCEI